MDTDKHLINWALRLAIIAPLVIVTMILVCLVRKFRTKCFGISGEEEVTGNTTRANRANSDTREANENGESTEPDNVENQDLRIYRNRRSGALNELPSLFTGTNDMQGPRLNLEVSIVGLTTTDERAANANSVERELRTTNLNTEPPPPYSALFYAPPPSYETATQ